MGRAALAPEKDDQQLSEWLADYFNCISSEYLPYNRTNVPVTYQRVLPTISAEEVTKKLRRTKITSSVPGDLPAALYTNFARLIAEPVTHVFNTITESGEWSSDWATEQVTVIPKSRHSERPSECRNISCTNFLSKIYESFVLMWARGEVMPKSNQYGGEPGCGTTHLLVQAMDNIPRALEDNRSAVVLTSVDFSKAFNRLEHGSCLQAFAKKGLSTQIIKLLAGFMCGRTMTVKVGAKRSVPRPVNAGAPRGLFLAATSLMSE